MAMSDGRPAQMCATLLKDSSDYIIGDKDCQELYVTPYDTCST